jgi:electron transport complex protein RnfE
VLGRADAFASKNPVLPAALDGFMMGLGFLVILLILGGMRELIGQGTLFTNMQLLFGPMAADWQLQVVENYGGFLFAILPPGAFVGLGLIIAGKNVIDKRLKAIQKARASDEPKVSRRVRTTGKVS